MRCPNKKCFIRGTTGNFCGTCGTKLEKEHICEHCGRMVMDETDKYCRNCGKKWNVKDNG